MLKSIQFLESKLATLLDYVRQLQLSNQQLRQEVERLEQEKSALHEHMTQAQMRIDKVIQQLKTEASKPVDSNSEHE